MGRPGKGTRMRVNLRVPLALYVALSRRAVTEGVDLNAWCVAVLEREVAR